MNTQHHIINNDYHLPQGFYDRIAPYVVKEDHRRVMVTPDELLALWQDALAYREQYPTLQESIAEWTMSAAASSPLVDDNDIFEAIHLTFGELEVSPQDSSDAEWRALGDLVANAKVEVENRRQR